MLLPAVFSVSLASLAYEVLLTRTFAVSQWNHLAFMVISIALFGFAASGTFLGLLDHRRPGWVRHWPEPAMVRRLVILFSLVTLISFCGLNRLPLDYFRLPVDPAQALYLLAAYLLLALPFFFTGLLTSIAYTTQTRRTGRVYCVSMTGSAIGALVPGILLPVFSTGTLVVMYALLPLCVCAGPPLNRPCRLQGYFVRGCGLVCLAAIGMVLVNTAAPLLRVRPSDYKYMSQILRFPHARLTAGSHHLTGRIDRLESPSLRFAPGLSLTYEGPLPQQTAVFKDADAFLMLYDTRTDWPQSFARHTLPHAAYVLVGAPQTALIIQNGGGTAVVNALAAGIAAPTIVEPNPQWAAILQDHYGIPVTTANPRAYLNRSAATFDVIQIESWGGSIPGATALEQSTLLTTNALSLYLSRLKPDGILLMARKTLLPPADSLRLWATAYESLQNHGAAEPARHLVMIRNWDTFALIVSRQPLRLSKRFTQFVRRHNFDWVHTATPTGQPANHFNRFKAPYYHQAVTQLNKAYAQGHTERFFSDYNLDVRPQSDDRPFPGRHMKWTKIRAMYHAMGSRLYAVMLSGEIIVAVVFGEAVVIAALLLLVPMMAGRHARQHMPWRSLVFFLAVGAGFILVELYFIKQFTQVFIEPAISFAVVLAGILAFSGLGGLLSQYCPRAALPRPTFGAAGVLLLIPVTRFWWHPWLLSLAFPMQVAGALALIAVPGMLMGFPFALGMRFAAQTSFQRVYAWAANGCASVLSAVAAAQISLAWGLNAIMIGAVTCYIGAGILAAVAGRPTAARP